MGLKKMNKLLLVENINKISTGTYELEYNKDSNIELNGDISLFNYDTKNYNLNINLLDNTILKGDFVSIAQKDFNLTLNINNNNQVLLNYLIINEGQNKINITLNITGNSSYINIIVRVINKTKDSNADIICDGIIKENTHDNELLQDLKGLITNNDTIKISPNMLINTNEVLANHKVTISSYNPTELFYLTSKGLSLKLAKKLILSSFITSFINEIYHEKIKTEVKINE